MKILILHRIPYHKIDYHRGIDHTVHDVTYIGTRDALATIPNSLRAERIERPGRDRVVDEVLRLVEPLDGQFDRVISLSEYELIDAAQIREALGVQGPKVSEVEKVRNKVIMKGVVEKVGIRVPKYFPCSLLFSRSQKSAPTWTGRTVLKPVDGASSENVMVFDTAAEALFDLNRNGKRTNGLDIANFELEEFVSGQVIHIDGLVQGSKPVCMLGSGYIGTCLEYANGQPLGSVQFDISEKLKIWAAACIDAVGINDGAFHLEAILTPHGPVFLEIGHRVGGADVVETFELATGIHLPSEELRILLAENKVNEVHKLKFSTIRPKKYGWFVIPGHHLPPGDWKVSGTEYFSRKPGVQKWKQLPFGAPLPKRISYQAHEVPVAGILSGESSEDVIRDMVEIFNNVHAQSVLDQRRSV